MDNFVPNDSSKGLGSLVALSSCKTISSFLSCATDGKEREIVPAQPVGFEVFISLRSMLR